MSANPCDHQNHLVVLPLLEVLRDGSEVELGRVQVCDWSGWVESKRHGHCYALWRVRADLKAGWPDAEGRGLVMSAVKDMVHRRPPTTWLSTGYHLSLRAGEWMNLRDNGGKPVGDLAELCPLARRILQFRPRYGSFLGDHPELDLAAAGQGQDAIPAASEEDFA